MKTDISPNVARTKQTFVMRRIRKNSWMLLVVLLVVAATAVRMARLDSSPFWVDEAESAINALTILDDGYPTDSYLGMPIYENTFVWFSPESLEYEFRDVSYSDKGFAVYHGWLPLYAIAASFAIHGVQPDHADGGRSTRHTLAEQKRRTRAARLPSVFFGALFLITVFIGGNTLFGRAAGWAALILAAIHPHHLSLSNQARYYSAQVTLTTACCLFLWLMIKHCKWKHIWMAAVLFVLLFHTHLLSFMTAIMMAAITMPVVIYRHRDWFRKMAVFAAIIAAGTLPWVIATGFYQHQGRIPRAWPLLQMPGDLMRYPPVNPSYVLPILVLVLAVFVVDRIRGRASNSPDPSNLGGVVLFLGGWALTGYATFLLCMPAVSFTNARLNLSYWGPLFLLFAVLTTAAARVLAPRLSQGSSALLASLLMLLMFFATGGRLHLGHRVDDTGWQVYTTVFRHLDSMRLDSTSRLYAAPNSHLVLTFYSGLPIQDLTPVRKSYLDDYRGDIAYIDVQAILPTNILLSENIRRAAMRDGYSLSPQAAQEMAVRLRTRPYREAMIEAVAPADTSSLEPLFPYARELLATHRADVAFQFANFGYELVTRGYEIRDWSDWSAVLKYRFVNPEARRGIHANYADRLKGADAIILSAPEPVAIYRSRWHPKGSTETLTFRFVDSALPVATVSQANAHFAGE